MSTLEIAMVHNALARHEAEVARMAGAWADKGLPCCPSCAFGREYTDACDQAERTRSWLVILLARKNTPESMREAERLMFDGVSDHARRYFNEACQKEAET